MATVWRDGGASFCICTLQNRAISAQRRGLPAAADALTSTEHEDVLQPFRRRPLEFR